MQVREVMTSNPACCMPDTKLQEVAHMMLDCDCGAIPVVDGKDTMKVVGIITDRDITCRTVAQGKDPMDMTARECMTSPVKMIMPEASLEECCQMLEQNQIRRLLVADGDGCCCGIVAQADIALNAPEEEIAEVVKDISLPGGNTNQAFMRH
jgi:CBS domain-containing protein